MKNYTYKKGIKLKFNNNIYQVFIREDKEIGFLKVLGNKDEEKYVYPSALEYLKLNSYMHPEIRIKF